MKLFSSAPQKAASYQKVGTVLLKRVTMESRIQNVDVSAVGDSTGCN